MIRIEVPLPDRTYPVLVGRGVRSELAAVLPPKANRAAVVTQTGIGVDVDPGIDHRVFTIADGETAKALATVEDLCRQWAQWGMTRADCVVAVGGGIVTDVAGFAAAVYHRGTAVVHVSTTLLGMIDAAIGGKTGVNLPEGKNLVGAFWQPAAVLCDLDALESLPPREFRAGMGELAKYRFLPGGDGLETKDLPEQIAQCIQIKADVVAADEREGGLRAILNYGHTLAHAIENVAEYELRHGEAVAVGLRYAAVLAHRLGRIDADRVALHERILQKYELPTTVPASASDDDLLAAMGRDKKAIGGLVFALDGPRGVEIVSGVDPADARAALAAVRA